VYLSGFGRSGPLGDRPVYDALVQARTGIAYAQGAANGGTPQLLPVLLADKVAAMFTAQAVLAGLVERDRTGRGRRLDLSMLEATAYFNFPDMMARRAVVGNDGPDLNAHLLAIRPLATADGWIVVSPTNADEIRRALLAVEQPDWFDEIMAAGDPERIAAETYRRLALVTPRRTTAEWERRFVEQDVAMSPVLSFDEHLADAQVQAAGTYGTSSSERYGLLRHAWHPLLDGASRNRCQQAPQLGGDPDSV
jgi:formyl-CoA transferase